MQQHQQHVMEELQSSEPPTMKLPLEPQQYQQTTQEGKDWWTAWSRNQKRSCSYFGDAKWSQDQDKNINVSHYSDMPCPIWGPCVTNRWASHKRTPQLAKPVPCTPD
ncbi:hypothetical protein Q8A73_006382 [Channa argus]|nr:hypothetical protein Q8A73_006382 [Channa argus]